MSEFKKYRRTAIAEMREVNNRDIEYFTRNGCLVPLKSGYEISISDADLENGSPKIGDMVARNPKNHNDQWLIAKDYFKDNFEVLK